MLLQLIHARGINDICVIEPMYARQSETLQSPVTALEWVISFQCFRASTKQKQKINLHRVDSNHQPPG